MIARVLTEKKAQLRGFVVGVERMTIDYYNFSWPITSPTALTSASLTFSATRRLSVHHRDAPPIQRILEDGDSR
jgi:hypothetical protein